MSHIVFLHFISIWLLWVLLVILGTINIWILWVLLLLLEANYGWFRSYCSIYFLFIALTPRDLISTCFSLPWLSIWKYSFPNLLTIFTTCLCLCNFSIDRLIISSSSVIGDISRLSGEAELSMYHGTIIILSTACLLHLSFTLHSLIFIGGLLLFV